MDHGNTRCLGGSIGDVVEHNNTGTWWLNWLYNYSVLFGSVDVLLTNIIIVS